MGLIAEIDLIAAPLAVEMDGSRKSASDCHERPKKSVSLLNPGPHSSDPDENLP